MPDGPTKPTAALVANVRRLRRKRGLTAEELADRLTELGVKIGRVGVVKLEGGNRKSVAIEELFALAVALNVSPLTLLVSTGDYDQMEVTPTTTATSVEVGKWVAGDKRLRNEGVPAWMDFVRELPHWKMVEAANTLERVWNFILDADERTVEQMKVSATSAGRAELIQMIDFVREQGRSDGR